jgi:hypothetical protein
MKQKLWILAAMGMLTCASSHVVTTSYAQTNGMDRRGDRRDDRGDGRDAKQECKQGDEKSRPECREEKRDEKHDGDDKDASQQPAEAAAPAPDQSKPEGTS